MASSCPRSFWLVIGPFLIVIGLALMITALVTNWWLLIDYEDDQIEAGLFKYCYKGICLVYAESDNIEISDELLTIQALCIGCVCLMGVAIIPMAVLIFLHRSQTSWTLGWLSLFLCVLAVVVGLGGVALLVETEMRNGHLLTSSAVNPAYRILDANSDSDFDLSFHLAWGSLIPVLLAALLAIPGIKYIVEDNRHKDANRKHAHPAHMRQGSRRQPQMAAFPAVQPQPAYVINDHHHMRQPSFRQPGNPYAMVGQGGPMYMVAPPQKATPQVRERPPVVGQQPAFYQAQQPHLPSSMFHY